MIEILLSKQKKERKSIHGKKKIERIDWKEREIDGKKHDVTLKVKGYSLKISSESERERRD